jgi:DNA polymerase III subunit gamma/tau
MEKKALYLKYRPKKISDIVGQKNFKKTMVESARIGKFSHAYLFCGEKGTGKTSSARIVANLMTCENISDGNVCGSCTSCERVVSSSSVDVIEVDGAKERKVEDINSLLEDASWAPNELSRKVIIIDEAHQLSSTAISSLLKIVEEPPEYLVFIFCTTELEKIPDTILSRSQKYIFKKIPIREISLRLKNISEEESINIEEKAIYGLSKMSRGSMREAIGYLEQVAIVANGRLITESVINKYFGAISSRGVYEIVTSMVEGNYSKVIDHCNDMVSGSVNIKDIFYEISEVFRNVMLFKIQGGGSRHIDLPDHELSAVSGISDLVSMSKISALSNEFSTIDKDLSYGINKRFVLESTLINCAYKLSNKKD